MTPEKHPLEPVFFRIWDDLDFLLSRLVLKVAMLRDLTRPANAADFGDPKRPKLVKKPEKYDVQNNMIFSSILFWFGGGFSEVF